MTGVNRFTGLFFGALPKLDDLVAVLVETAEERAMSTIQPHCCRELIFTDSRVLLSPCLENGKQTFIISQKSTWSCPKFQELIGKLHLKFVEEVSLTRSLFQYCLSFTLTQRLAPLWNKAGEFFIQGRDFLETSKLNAVSLEVNITDKICIGLEAFSVKLHPSKPEHFCGTTTILQRFLTDEEFHINNLAVQDDLCYVLPSLKKGRVVGICHRMPEDCPFSSYEDLRKHWKLMYGYRLPAQESVFYNVQFFYLKSKVFTYPASCIHSTAPQVSSRCDQQAIFTDFIKDIHSRMQCVCSIPFTLTSAPLYSTNRLFSASNDNQSNLTRTKPQLKHCTPFIFTARNVEPPSTVVNCSGANSSCNRVLSLSGQHQAEDNAVLPNQDINVTPKATPRFVPQFTSGRILTAKNESEVRRESSSSSSLVPSSTASRIMPRFTRKLASASTAQSDSTRMKKRSSSQHEVVSVFERGASDFDSVTSQPQTRPESVIMQSRFPDELMTGTFGSQDTNRHTGSVCNGVPHSGNHISTTPGHRDLSFLNTASSTRRLLPDTRPGLVRLYGPSTPAFVKGSGCATNRNQIPNTSQVDNRSVNSTVTSTASSRELPVQGRQLDRDWIAVRPGGTVAMEFQSSGWSPDEFVSHGVCNMASLTGSQQACRRGGTVLQRKRTQSDAHEGEPQKKKPRQKAKIQENVDVTQLAISNQLHKVNSTTLMDWLRKHHVTVKSKDKKSELMEKVMNQVTLNVHEL